MTTTIQTTLTGVTNYTDDKVEAIRALLHTYVPGFGQILKGVLPLGDENVPIPCVMIQAVSIDPQMITLGKTHAWHRVMLVFYVGGNTADEVALKSTDAVEIFKKLFSNNALNDLAGAHTNHFKNYEPHWIYSEMERVEVSPAFKNGRPGGPKYQAIGMFMLKLETVITE